MSIVHTSYRAALVVLASTLFVWGCGGPAATVDAPADVPAEFPNHSADDIVFEIRADTDDLEAFSGRAQLSIDSPSQRGTYSATLRNRRADSLFLSVGQFGFEGLRALVTSDSFYVYDLLRNRLTYGSVDDASSALPIPVGGDDVFRSLLGVIVPSSQADWRLNASGRYYTLTSPEQGQTLVVDPAIWRVIRYEERDASGDLVEERLYGDFHEFDGVLLPRRVTFNIPPQETSVTLAYRSISVNPESLDFGLRVNRSAERVSASAR